MTAFRYQAMEGSGAPVKGVIDAEDRKAALLLLGERGLFPSELQVCSPLYAAATIRRCSLPVAVRGMV